MILHTRRWDYLFALVMSDRRQIRKRTINQREDAFIAPDNIASLRLEVAWSLFYLIFIQLGPKAQKKAILFQVLNYH